MSDVMAEPTPPKKLTPVVRNRNWSRGMPGLLFGYFALVDRSRAAINLGIYFNTRHPEWSEGPRA